MRVIAGSAKGRKLEAPEGNGTRPTTDRFKEMVFDVLQGRVPGARFLDLFSGSGGMGIEALSRGAQRAVMVEADPQAAAYVQKNRDKTGFTAQSRLMIVPAETAILQLAREGERFDLIFMDPPYQKDWENRTADQIRQAGLLAPEGLLIIESSSQTVIEPEGWTIVKEKNHRVTKFTFLQLL
jgi:16S rRNA (guanine(966)-N(2))-methyltransferase RsmD